VPFKHLYNDLCAMGTAMLVCTAFQRIWLVNWEKNRVNFKVTQCVSDMNKTHHLLIMERIII